MKKSQVLAALALAFALGVVVPAATTSAYVYQYDRNGAEEEIVASRLIDDLRDEVAEGKKHKSIAEYNKYVKLVDLINGDTIVAISVPANVLNDTTSGYNTSGRNFNGSLNQIKNSQKNVVLRVFPSGYDTSTLANSSFEDVMREASRQLGILKDTNLTEYQDLKAKYDDANSYVMYAEEATIAAIQTELTTDFDYKGQAGYMVNTFTTDEDNDGKLESADFAGAKVYAERQTSDYNYYDVLVGAVRHAEDVLQSKATGGEKYTIAQAEAALAALKAAINGSTIPGDNNNGTGEGTNKPSDDKNEGNKAPNTGILAGAEGSASTTVAMVAGVATALTAAGAGVVAYRNARRSTRK